MPRKPQAEKKAATRIVRVSPETHREIRLYSKTYGCAMCDVVADAVRHFAGKAPTGRK